MEFQAASDYPTSHVMTPGQRQRMIDILQPVRWAGAMDGDTKAMVTQRNLLATLISMRRWDDMDMDRQRVFIMHRLLLICLGYY